MDLPPIKGSRIKRDRLSGHFRESGHSPSIRKNYRPVVAVIISRLPRYGAHIV